MSVNFIYGQQVVIMNVKVHRFGTYISLNEIYKRNITMENNVSSF